MFSICSRIALPRRRVKGEWQLLSRTETLII
jgi:hypothetical protein